MKRINSIYIAALFTLTALFSGCEDLRFGNSFLEKPPGGDTNITTIFSSRENSEQALTALYRELPDGLIIASSKSIVNDIQESLTDLNNCSRGWGPIRAQHYTGQINAATAGNQHRYNFSTGGGWAGIRDSWIYIENIDRVPDMSTQEKQARKAEARMIIAVHYADMMRHFGGLPWVGRSYSPSETNQFERMTIEQTINKIVELLDQAAIDLPWSVEAADDGRMTQAAAMGLKVRVLLFAASPLFNDVAPYMNGEAAQKLYVWYGNKDDKRWDKVVDAGKAFMDSLSKKGVYDLVRRTTARESFRDAYFTRGNGEVLISTRKQINYEKTLGGAETAFLGQCKYGIGNSTLDYVDMFPMATGEDFDWEKSEHAANPFIKINPDKSKEWLRDPRLYESVVINEDTYAGGSAQAYIGGELRPTEAREKTLMASGFAVRKFRQDLTSTFGKFYSWPHLRLAEVLLSYAEALNEVGRTNEAYDLVSMVRSRVGMPNFKSGMDIPTFREAIIRERALEFGYEEVRLFDLVRWKRVADFKKKLRGLDIRKRADGDYTYEQFEIPIARAWQGDRWNAKWLLCPIPTDEINKKYGLVQNPGW